MKHSGLYNIKLDFGYAINDLGSGYTWEAAQERISPLLPGGARYMRGYDRIILTPQDDSDDEFIYEFGWDS